MIERLNNLNKAQLQTEIDVLNAKRKELSKSLTGLTADAAKSQMDVIYAEIEYAKQRIQTFDSAAKVASGKESGEEREAREWLEAVDFLNNRANTHFVEGENVFYQRMLHKDPLTGRQYGEWYISTRDAFRGSDERLDAAGTWNKVRKSMRQGMNGCSFKRKAIHTIAGTNNPDHLNLWVADSILPLQEGEVHKAFDYLMEALSGGKKEAADHIEQVIGYKYMNLFSYNLPMIVWYGEGRGGKSILTQLVLGTLFHPQYVGRGSMDDMQTYQDMLKNLLVFMFDEKEIHYEQMPWLRSLVGNPTFPLNQKYGKIDSRQENSILWFAGVNTNHPLRLNGDSSDDRFSLIKLHTPLWKIFVREGLVKVTIGEDPHGKVVMARALTEVDKKCNEVFRNIDEVAKFANRCVQKAKELGTMPIRYRDENYTQMSFEQKEVWEEICEAVFKHDKDFTHIQLETLYQLYIERTKKSNPSARPKKEKLFAGDVVGWLSKHRQDVGMEERVRVKLTASEIARLHAKGEGLSWKAGEAVQKTVFARTARPQKGVEANNIYYFSQVFEKQESDDFIMPSMAPAVDEKVIVMADTFTKAKPVDQKVTAMAIEIAAEQAGVQVEPDAVSRKEAAMNKLKKMAADRKARSDG